MKYQTLLSSALLASALGVVPAFAGGANAPGASASGKDAVVSHSQRGAPPAALTGAPKGEPMANAAQGNATSTLPTANAAARANVLLPPPTAHRSANVLSPPTSARATATPRPISAAPQPTSAMPRATTALPTAANVTPNTISTTIQLDPPPPQQRPSAISVSPNSNLQNGHVFRVIPPPPSASANSSNAD